MYAKPTRCLNCLQWFTGGHAKSQHMSACNGDSKQCPVCRDWFRTQGERDKHMADSHPGA